ncbi:uncharacterized protein LOC134762134 [Pongo abelii]|uniref:uncharacterized protein LOC134762134 n=1 Tax=Pongo abelii TaxID=9601 RepID=UPI0030062336
MNFDPALGLLTPTLCPEVSPPPPTSHSPLSSEPTQGKKNWTARPSRQYDIKKRGGEEEEGAEPKESAPSTSQSPPPDRILEAAGDCSNRAPRHGIPARPSQGTPERGRNASETRAVVSGARSGNRDLVGSFPTQVSRRQARPAPSPNTHSLSAPQQEQPAQAPHPGLSAPVPMSSPRPKPLRASCCCQGSRPAPAPHSLRSGEDNRERVSQRIPSQTTWTHRESPRARPPESQHQASQSPPESTSGSPTIPLGNNGGWGSEPQAGLRMLGPALL